MNRCLPVCIGLISLSLLMTGNVCFSQSGSSTAGSDSGKTQIIYTGKLLGYFRFPSRQPSTLYRCPDLYPLETGDARLSSAAFEFLNQREKSKAVLVGTGDNFAPQLEARVLDPAPPPNPGSYPRGNKELFYGDGNNWIGFDQVQPGSPLQDRLNRGVGAIPLDNVGCFLAAARYDAVVPGKHDFYFGAERVRHLARFMASINSPKPYKPVQMLGANLVLRTVPINPQPISPSQIEKPEFKTEWPETLPVLSPTAGQTVYPWFSYVRLKFRDIKSNNLLSRLDSFVQTKSGSASAADLKVFLQEEKDLLARSPKPTPGSSEEREYLEYAKEVEEVLNAFPASLPPHYICLSEGHPNKITQPVATNSNCKQLKEDKLRLVGKSLVFYLPLDPVETGKDGHFSTLLMAKNYGLCRVEAETYCRTFSVHTPFFYFPNGVPKLSGQSGYGYNDPDPYVLLEDQNTVIFGVVDTNLGQQVGLLNFSWPNTDSKLKTLVGVEDPAEALRQQLEYFERRYGKPFAGLKVLLAQMSPLKARVLAARFPNFQVIVTEADREQGTSETSLTTLWTPQTRAGSFLAVPSPFFDSERAEGKVHFSWVDASSKGASWLLESNSLPPTTIKSEKEKAPAFWGLVEKKLVSCLPREFAGTKATTITPSEQLKWLVLCAMRDETRADVALIQKRDLFDDVPIGSGDAPTRAQQILDRLIWKGDLLTLMYVPGSAIKQALKKSGEYEAEETSTLSLANERRRGLEALGISYSEAKEPLINEAPIDDKKIYAVATTDYIGAGDTGYPDLTAAALNPRTHPAGYPDQLDTISGLVCRRLYPDQANQYCQSPINREAYLDKSTAKQIAAFPRPNLGNRFWAKFPLQIPSRNIAATKIPEALQEKVQRRPIWTLSLKNLSFGFTGLFKNMSDEEITQNFAGVSASDVKAKKSHSYTVGLNTQLSRSTHQGDFFVASAIDFKRESIGERTPDNEPDINQLNNRVTADVGYLRNLWGGRSQTRLGAVVSLRTETSLQTPFDEFSLGTGGDPLKIYRDRSVLLLPRVGIRWQHLANHLELGGQWGKEIDALIGYRFNTQGTDFECLLNSSETLADCIKRLSTPPVDSITRDSESTPIYADRTRRGLYSNSALTFPFHNKVSYEFTEEADYFFNLNGDTAADTKYRILLNHRLKLSIFPSLSIGPTWKMLLYKNKQPINSKFQSNLLFQQVFGFEASFGFNLFNRREPGVQFQHKP